MHLPFQKTLYRHENNTWHYLRLIWQESAQSFEVRTAPCGQMAMSSRQEALLAGEMKEAALHRLVAGLLQAGYSENPKVDLFLAVQIFTPAWAGFTTDSNS